MLTLRITIFVLVIMLGACAQPSTSPPTTDSHAVETRIAAQVFATQTANVQTATATPACDPSTFLQSSADIIDKFNELDKRANATARVALSSVIGEMQDERRAHKNLVAPLCAQQYQAFVLGAMQAQIDAYLSFMMQESSDLTQRKFKVAADAWKQARKEYASLRNASSATPTPPNRAN